MGGDIGQPYLTNCLYFSFCFILSFCSHSSFHSLWCWLEFRLGLGSGCCVSLIRLFYSFNLANDFSKRGEQLTLGEAVPVPLGFLEHTLISFFWLLIPIDLPLKLSDDLLELCICCFTITGFKGLIKLSTSLVDVGISELFIEVS